MQKFLPQTDFVTQDALLVCVMTKDLWKSVVKHIDLFFDIVNTHPSHEGIEQIKLVQNLLP